MRGHLRNSRLLALLVLWAATPAVPADDAAPPPRSWRLERVAADDPTQWPAGDWRPVLRTELDQFLLDQALPSAAISAPEVRLWRAAYVGRLQGDELQGHCRWTLPAGRTPDSDVVLRPLNLRVSNVQAGERPAVWGRRGDGTAVLAPAADSDELTADWSLRGRRVFDDLEFAVESPQAAVSRYELELPRGTRLAASSGVVTGPEPGTAPELQRWTIELGRRSQWTLTISPAVATVAVPLLTRESLALTVLGEGLDFVADYEVVTGSAEDLHWELPSQLQLQSVTLGADTALPFRVSSRGSQQRVSVSWPVGLAERELRIRLRGFAPTGPGELETLPVLRLLNGEVLESQLALHIRPPMMAEGLTPDGYRIIDRRTDAEQVETWLLQAVRREPTVALQLTLPPPQLSYRFGSAADFRGPIARWRTRLRIEGGGGETFAIRARCPAEWDVVDVVPFRGEAATIIAGFDVVPDSDARWNALSIQLRQALEPNDQLELLITAVMPSPGPAAPVASPLWRPEQAIRSQGLLAIVPPSGAEVSGALTLPATPPTPESLNWLQAAAPDIDLSHALLIEYPGADSPQSTAPLQFDPIAPRESSAVVPAPAAAEPVNVPAPHVGELRLTTYLAEEGAADHHHVAEFPLLAPVTGRQRFHLPPSCAGLRLVADDVAVESGFGAESVELTAHKSIVLHYRSPAGAGAHLLSDERLPVPVWEGVTPHLTWHIRPSSARACASLVVPFGRVVERGSWSWMARCFGPLAAGVSAPDGGRDTASDGIATRNRTASSDHTMPGIVQVEVAQAPAELQIRTWNPALAERIAWTVLLGMLVLGGVVRRFRGLLWRRAWVVVCFGLSAVTWFAADPFVRPAGAAGCGAILSLGLPRRMVLRGGRRAPSRDAESSRSTALPAVMTGLLVCGWCALVPSVLAQPAVSAPAAPVPAPSPLVGLLPERDGEAAEWAFLQPPAAAAVQAAQSRRPASARWLIRQAEFDIAVADEAAIEARFEVWLPPSAVSTPVRLAFGDVTFDSADAVQVDGQPGTLIPSSQNDGVFVYLEPSPRKAEPDTAGPVSVWSRHDVVIHCRVQVQSLAGGRRFALRVPPATELRVQFTGAPAQNSRLRINGLPLSAAGECLLGSVSQMEVNWPTAESNSDAAEVTEGPVTVASVIDLGPLQQTAAAGAILSPTSGLGEAQWTLPLRPEWTVQQVDVPAGVRWRMRATPQGPVLDVLTLTPSADFVIGLRAVRAVDAGLDASQTVSLVPVWRETVTPAQALQWRVAAGFEADVRQRELPTATDPTAWTRLPDELQQRLGPLTGAAALWTSASSWTARLQPQATTRVAAIDHWLTARRTQLEWRSVIALDVGGAPTSQIVLRIDPALSLDRVTVLHDGADRLERQIRRGERLELILARPLAGPVRMEFSGTAPLSARVARPFPHIEIVDGRIVATACRVTNQSGWEVELTPPDGAALRLPATPPGATAAELLVTLVPDDARWNLQLLPGPDAAAYDSVVQFLSSPDGRPQQRYSALLRPQGVPLADVRLRVPPQLQSGLTIVPEADVVSSEQQADGWRQLTFRPARLRGGVYRIQLQSDLELPAAATDWSYVPPQCRDAVPGDQYLLVDEAFPYRPTSASGTTVAAESLPPRLRWLRRSASASLVNMLPDLPAWTFTAYSRESAATSVPLAETIVWLDDTKGLHGVTTVTLLSTQADHLAFRVPRPLQVTSWTVDGARLTAEAGASDVVVEIPPQLTGSIGILTWQSPERGKSADAIPLPQPMGWTPAVHLAAVVASGDEGTRPANVATPAAAACRRMEGLLSAMDRLATRTLPLDCLLLGSLRAADAELDRFAAAPETTAEDVRECRSQRERWRQVHNRISVQSEAPGAVPDRTVSQRPWELLGRDHNLNVAVLPSDAADLPLATAGNTLRPVLTAVMLVVLLAGILRLQAAETTQRAADWLADRPEVGCLVLGLLWTAALQPRAVGIVLMLAGLAGLSRRRPSRAHRDTALIGPGR